MLTSELKLIPVISYFYHKKNIMSDANANIHNKATQFNSKNINLRNKPCG